MGVSVCFAMQSLKRINKGNIADGWRYNSDILIAQYIINYKLLRDYIQNLTHLEST